MIFKNVIKPSLILAAVVFASSFALSHVHKITAPAIEKQKAGKEKEALFIILPGFAIGDEKTDVRDDRVFRYWVGEKKNEDDTVSEAYAFITASPGYSGDIRSIVGISGEGDIIGIYIIEQTETPGLGTRAVESSDDGPPWFQRQFAGLNVERKISIEKLGDWTPEIAQTLSDANAITAITGATITCRAVIKSIEEGYARLSLVLGKKKEKEKESETE